MSIFKVTILIILIFSFSSSMMLYAIEIRLNPPKKFYLEGDDIYIDLTSRESLLSGDDLQNLYFDIPITITYYIEFYEDKLLLFDEQLIDLALVRKLNYDHWSKNFFVEEGSSLTKYRNLTQLRNNIINLRMVKLINKNEIDGDKKYYFKTRIAIKIKNFTLYYYLINNLISIFKYKTTYYISPSYSGREILNLAKGEGANE